MAGKYMHIHILLALLIFIPLMLIIKLRLKVNPYLKRMLLPIAVILFILCLILFSHAALKAAGNGIQLWFNIVLPSLFPFFVGSEILYRTGIVKVGGVLLEPIMRPLFNLPGCGSFPFLMGITSGYPVGAKLTTDMHREKLLSTEESNRLLAFSNNSGPLFIVGAVAVGMYHQPRLGLILLACHIAACITVGILFGVYSRRKGTSAKASGQLLKRLKAETKVNLSNPAVPVWTLLGEAIKNSVGTMLAIGGFIVFFAVIIQLLMETGLIQYIASLVTCFTTPFGIHEPIITSLLSGSFEITTGAKMTQLAVNASVLQKLTAVSMIIGWAGLSVHAQVASIISSSGMSMKPYLMGKFLQGLTAGIYTFLFLKIAGPGFLGNRPAFSSFIGLEKDPWQDYFISSCQYFLLCSFFFVLSAILCSVYRHFRKLLMHRI